MKYWEHYEQEEIKKKINDGLHQILYFPYEFRLGKNMLMNYQTPVIYRKMFIMILKMVIEYKQNQINEILETL